MILPTIPSFAAGETSLTHLQQLSAAVQFATVASSYPVWRFYKTATQSLTVSVWNTLTFGSVALDTDSVWNGSGATIVTQGYYATEACVPIKNTTSVIDFQICFMFTAGTGNAHYTSGTQFFFGGHGGTSGGSASVDCAECIADYCPVVCYPGDQIAVQAFVTTATTTNVLVNTSATAGWFVPQFTGRWVRTGS